jgi:SusD family.
MKDIKYIIPIIAASALAVSCDGFLDKMPDNRTEIDTEEKVVSLLTSAYPEKSFIVLTEMISDNVDDYRISYTNTDRYTDEVFAWKDVTESDNESPESIWESSYGAVAAANEALKSIEALGCNTDVLRGAKAEALLCRAYGHFVVATIFCEAYTEKTASRKLGIPFIDKPETTLLPKYERGTLAEVYARIDADIEEALSLLNDSYLQVPKYHFNKKAAYSFASRFNLYYEKWDKAIEYSKMALGAQPDAVLRSWAGLAALPSTSYEQLTNAFIDATEPANFLLCTAYSTAGIAFGPYTKYNAYSHGAYISDTEDILADNIWGSSASSYVYKPKSYLKALDRVCFWKLPFLFEYTDAVAGIGYYRTVYPAFWADETLLTHAEALVLTGKYEEAASDINLWIHNFTTSKKTFKVDDIVSFYNKARYHSWDRPSIKKHLHPGFDIGAEGDTKEAMLQCIIGIRRIETMHQGLRWFDIKRYGIEIERRIMNAAGEPQAISDALLKDDPRRAVQIPLKVTDAGLEANPRTN